jgi:glycosyltransferase involved in cell wall biosynthesis
MLHRLTGRPVVLYVTGIGLDTKQIKIPTAPARTFVISPYLQAWNPNAEILPPVLPTDFGPEPREPQISDESAPFRFLYLGSLERGRGVAQLVHAYALAWASSERRVALRLAINGLGLPDKEAQLAITRAQHLGADLSIEGVVDLTETYAQCEVVVIPRVGTARMAMPLRLLEALHFAKPLIVTDACDMGTLIRGGGLQVPSGDSDALAEAMVALANDTALYVSCAQSAKAAASHYASTEPLRRLHEALLVASRSGTVKRRGNRVKTQPDN